jgi:hypothetical protein
MNMEAGRSDPACKQPAVMKKITAANWRVSMASVVRYYTAALRWKPAF